MSLETVTYGGYQLQNARVDIRADTVIDSDERTVLGTQYAIGVTGWFTGTTTDTFSVRLKEARGALAKNSQRLLIRDEDAGVTILDLDPASFAADAIVHDYGPRVTNWSVSEIAGLRAARYSWRATAFRKDCGASLTGVAAGILSIQRTYSYSIDVHGYATRAVSGTLKCTRQASPADQYRALVTPPLPTRFQRILAQYSQSPDARSLTFNVVDQEVYSTLPTPVASGEATWGVKIADLGARVFYVLNGRFRGGPTTPKPQLFQSLLFLIQSRFPLADPSLIFEEASVDDTVYDNEISFSIVASGVIGTLTNQTQIFNSLFKGMMTPPPQSNGVSFLPGPYGDLPGSPHFAKTQPFYDACTSPVVDEVASSPVSVEGSRTDGLFVPGGGGWNDAVAQDGVSAAHLNTPFVEFTESIGYHFDYKVSRMDKKDDGSTVASPDFSQSSRPSVTAVQAGYMRCYAKSASDLPPPPALVWPSGHLREAYAQPDVGQPVADGVWKLFTVHWRYVVEWPGYVSAQAPGDSFVSFPVEPRLGPSGTSQGNMAGKMPWLNGSSYS